VYLYAGNGEVILLIYQQKGSLINNYDIFGHPREWNTN